jgi:small subunit ribosomal protein S3
LGRKVHPLGFRLGIVKEHRSRWFATGKDYVAQIEEDRRIRELISVRLPKAGISHIEIERQPNQVYVIINTAKPGIIIGRKGTTVNDLRIELQDLTGKRLRSTSRRSPSLRSMLSWWPKVSLSSWSGVLVGSAP